MKKQFLFSLFFSASLSLSAQKQGQDRIDSLISEIPKALTDTNKVKLLCDISASFWSVNPREGVKYGKQALELAENLGWKKGMASAYGRIGINYGSQDDQNKALEYHFKSMHLNEELGNKKAIAGNLNNIGNVYLEQVDYPVSLEYYQKALKINEEIGNINWAGRNLGNMANIYWHQKKYKDAETNYLKAIDIFEKLSDKNSLALNLGNLGNVYNDQGDFQEALIHYFKALNIQREIGDDVLMGLNYGNIAGNYMIVATNPNQAALNKLFNGNKKIALLTAMNYIDSAIAVDTKFEILKSLSDNYRRKSGIESLLGDDKAALKNFKTATLLNDSIFTMEKAKKLTETAMQFEFDKKEAKTKAEQEKKDSVQRNIRYFTLIGLVVAIIFSVVLYRQRNRLKSEKKEVEKQKLLVDAKNHEILDSIHYAKRIQNSLLPTEKYIEKNLTRLKDKK
jgi:tetratricopeptide (TPR) repeat protein